jgi:hypothetical protein
MLPVDWGMLILIRRELLRHPASVLLLVNLSIAHHPNKHIIIHARNRKGNRLSLNPNFGLPKIDVFQT